MAITHGMNPDEVDALAQQLESMAGQIRDICGRLNSQVHSTTWEGPDASMFKNDWWPGHQQSLQSMAEALSGFGQSARNNASAQRQASAS